MPKRQGSDAGRAASSLIRFLKAFLLATLAAMLPVAVAAQVLEIGDEGAVIVHDRPAVFDAEGSAPIETASSGSLQPGSARGPGRPSRVSAPPGPPTALSLHALVEAAHANDLSPDLLEAVAWQESRMRSGVISRAGAIGEMQLMPGTARDLGVNPYDTRQNFHGGARYLSGMMRRYNGDLVLALAAYNAGPGTVDRYRGVPPYRETREYVAAIMHRLSQRAVSTSMTVAGR